MGTRKFKPRSVCPVCRTRLDDIDEYEDFVGDRADGVVVTMIEGDSFGPTQSWHASCYAYVGSAEDEARAVAEMRADARRGIRRHS